MSRHGFVRWVWRVIDSINDRMCARETLPLGVQAVEIPYGQAPAQALDVYRPEGTNLPVVVYVHGGGFVAGDKRHTKRYCMELAQEGFVVVNTNYRLAPGAVLDQQLADLLEALAWTKANIANHGGDPTRIVLAGNSAGSYLTAFSTAICTNPQLAREFDLDPVLTEELKGVALFSGLYDLATGARRSFPGIQSDIEMALGIKHISQHQKLEKYSVLKYITPAFPPAFVSCGEIDGLYPESLELVQALEQSQVPVTKVLFARTEKSARHDFQNRPGPASEQSFRELVKFLAQVTSCKSL